MLRAHGIVRFGRLRESLGLLSTLLLLLQWLDGCRCGRLLPIAQEACQRAALLGAGYLLAKV